MSDHYYPFKVKVEVEVYVKVDRYDMADPDSWDEAAAEAKKSARQYVGVLPQGRAYDMDEMSIEVTGVEGL
ncbi:hypothetical protein BH762_gp036 [Gordonia phage OneUp]|uniref:Uncharacterized protein n=1 Tax=Gordonia phage OneUp TaxID=1838074 RepID=A0A160DF34_9CAUD|nr:hypothetical protein BH762_gp036 [Gordonia phage OneUp]ANA86482.1 hypothetical protein PBI_ONEUP_149 [Gordonia phage OneUp]